MLHTSKYIWNIDILEGEKMVKEGGNHTVNSIKKKKKTFQYLMQKIKTECSKMVNK